MNLYLDLSQPNIMLAALRRGQKNIHLITQEANRNQAENFLILIDKLFSKAKIKPKDLSSITINHHGTFTNARLVASIANALSYAFDLKIIGPKPLIIRLKNITIAQPIYNQPPNIN